MAAVESRKRKTASLFTVWGERLAADATLPVLSEHPRPQCERKRWLNLNGWWQCTVIAPGQSFSGYDGSIRVPFSPEAPLAGYSHHLQPGETLLYRREFTIEPSMAMDAGALLTCRLHFGAVDQRCTVKIDDVECGSHQGGYLPFYCDLGKLELGRHVLEVAVHDDTDRSHHARGKQSSKPGGIWYTAQSGIWQTVWLEWLADEHLASWRIDSDLASSAFIFSIVAVGDRQGTIRILDDQVVVSQAEFQGSATVRLTVPTLHVWSCEDPHLYGVELRYGSDVVTSYAAAREISIGTDANGNPCMVLNGNPCFQAGVLDQGYWPDGLYTAPSDEALVHDIATMKAMGFTMVRKHIKIEPERWYWHCDRLGMLVWQDMVNGGGRYWPPLIAANALLKLRFDDRRHRRLMYRSSAQGRQEYEREMEQTIALLHNHPCIVVWVAFNEGWGQFDSLRIARRIKELDPSRIVDHASGWYDQGGPDLKSMHIYFRAVSMPARDGRPVVLSEFGGYGLKVEGHAFSLDKTFGYKNFKTKQDLQNAYAHLIAHEIAPLTAQGLCASVYTQLSDVEDEINGLLTYDRRVEKMDRDVVWNLNQTLRLG